MVRLRTVSRADDFQALCLDLQRWELALSERPGIRPL